MPVVHVSHLDYLKENALKILLSAECENDMRDYCYKEMLKCKTEADFIKTVQSAALTPELTVNLNSASPKLPNCAKLKILETISEKITTWTDNTRQRLPQKIIKQSSI